MAADAQISWLRCPTACPPLAIALASPSVASRQMRTPPRSAAPRHRRSLSSPRRPRPNRLPTRRASAALPKARRSAARSRRGPAQTSPAA
eukprot:4998477-Prymnesium_polylepis.1